jgi:type IV pilus assembly protein PilA
MEKGFTILELLVVLTIVGVLTATAIPAYQDYKARSFDFRALSDLRSAAIAEEAHFLDTEQYLTCNNAECGSLPGFSKLSEGVTLEINAEEDYFTGKASHPKGSGKEFLWDSSQGGLQ